MQLEGIFIFTDIIMTICILTSYITLLIIFANTNGMNLANVTDLADNWNYGPIIEAYKNTQGCGMDDSLLMDAWQGTVEGCSTAGSVRRGRCGKTGTFVYEQPPIAYQVWRGANMCAKRVSASYLDLTIAKNENSCPTGMRSCGLVDTLNNVMCVPTKTKCPYNYLEFIPDNQPKPTGFQFNSTSLKNSTMYSSNVNTKGKIINQFDVSEEAPCTDTYYQSYKYPLYVLEFFQERSTCSAEVGVPLYEPSYELKDSYSYLSLYVENGIYDVLNTMPFFQTYYQSYLLNNNRNMNLYHRNYIGITVECHNKIKESGKGLEIMIGIFSIEQQVADASAVALIAIIIGSIGMALHLFYFIIIIFKICEEFQTKSRFFLSIGPTILLSSIFICGCILFVQFSGLSIDFGVLTESNCTTNLDLLNKLQLASNLNSKAYPLAFVTMIGSGISLLVFILTFIYACTVSDD